MPICRKRELLSVPEKLFTSPRVTKVICQPYLQPDREKKTQVTRAVEHLSIPIFCFPPLGRN